MAETTAAVVLPRDYGAHPAQQVEWWYVTGALEAAAKETFGFQITFFRVRTGVAAESTSRFAARQLLFAHAAITDLGAKRLRHDQRIARAGSSNVEAAEATTSLALGRWRLLREADGRLGRYRAEAQSETGGFAYKLELVCTQPPLLQGVGGFSQKGPSPAHGSAYYSEPQLEVSGELRIDGRTRAVGGRAWLDHEWSDSYLDPAAVGWDWLGINLDDGSALMAFRIRRADGSSLWSGGSHRPAAGGPARVFAAGEVVFTPGRLWRSPASGAAYPVEWRLDTPLGAYILRALQDDQELDSRASTGAIYWEGLSLLEAGGRRVGRGYLEMTGYASPLVL